MNIDHSNCIVIPIDKGEHTSLYFCKTHDISIIVDKGCGGFCNCSKD